MPSSRRLDSRVAAGMPRVLRAELGGDEDLLPVQAAVLHGSADVGLVLVQGRGVDMPVTDLKRGTHRLVRRLGLQLPGPKADQRQRGTVRQVHCLSHAEHSAPTPCLDRRPLAGHGQLWHFVELLVRPSAAAPAKAGSIKIDSRCRGSAADSLVSRPGSAARSFSGYGLVVIVSNTLFCREALRWRPRGTFDGIGL